MTEKRSAGIWPPAEALYIQAMLFNARSAMTSVDRVATILEDISSGRQRIKGDGALVDEILNNLQNIVVNCAALSRYLWPTDRRRQARGEQLRRSLGIADDSPLKSRALRNDIEHMDERLDDYLAEGVVGFVLPQFVGRATPSNDGVPGHLFRGYFVDRGIFQLLGQRYEIQPIADAIHALAQSLEGFAEAGGRPRPWAVIGQT